MKLNINDRIKVKLTVRGERVHFDHYYQWLKNIRSLEDCMPKPDKEGYTEYQLWEFANIFGEHLYNGAEQIIKDNEIIFVERLRKDSDCALMYQGKRLVRCKECFYGKLWVDKERILCIRDIGDDSNVHDPDWFCASGELT